MDMDMFVPVTKAWVDPRNNQYGEKPYLLNPNAESFEGMEECFLKRDGKSIVCTKIFYSSRFITLLGSPDEFLRKCKEANLAFGLLLELGAAGMTIKEFIQQNERLNNVNFS